MSEWYMVTVGGFTYKTRLSRGVAVSIRRKLVGHVINVHVKRMGGVIG